MKIFVDCFTVDSIGTKFPEDSFICSSLEEVHKIIADVSRPISGIKKVEVWFESDRPTEIISTI